MKQKPEMAIRTARPDEWSAAFSLAFQHLGQDVRPARLQNALALVAQGVIDPGGILVATDGCGLRGVQVCVPLPGASGLFWLPCSSPPDAALEEQLIQTALDSVRRRGAKLAQAIFTHLDRPFVGALERCGFRLITQLHYFEHALQSLPPPIGTNVQYNTYDAVPRSLFHATLLQTYQGTLDCPELNGLRTIEEVIAGHQAQGVFRPEHWLLAWRDGRPAAVAMLMELPDLGVWDLAYLGVVPEFRRRGLGREMATHLLSIAKAAGALKLSLAVDERNAPAIQLYEKLGFISKESRDVYLYFWNGPLAGS
jgi:mycothiol synthase